MTPRKTARNARIVRLRDVTHPAGTVFTWAAIARVVSSEFPDDPITRQRAQQIYASEKK